MPRSCSCVVVLSDRGKTLLRDLVQVYDDPNCHCPSMETALRRCAVADASAAVARRQVSRTRTASAGLQAHDVHMATQSPPCSGWSAVWPVRGRAHRWPLDHPAGSRCSGRWESLAPARERQSARTCSRPVPAMGPPVHCCMDSSFSVLCALVLCLCMASRRVQNPGAAASGLRADA